MIFTVIIALEFKRSLLVVGERRHGIIQVRTVLLIALLAVVRKLMIIDLSEAEAQQVFALAAAILALGARVLARSRTGQTRAAPLRRNAQTGSRTVNTEPWFSSLTRVTSPPISRASLRMMASPRPLPP